MAKSKSTSAAKSLAAKESAKKRGRASDGRFVSAKDAGKAVLDKKFDHISGFGVKSADRAIFVPTVDKAFYVAPDHAHLLGVVDELAKTVPQNLLLTGPQGCGKTELGIWLAAKFKRPCVVMNCATIRETKDWFGYRDAKAGTLSWHKSDFVRAIEKGGIVILLDEFNRLHTTLHNAIYPLLDARRCTFVEEVGEMIHVGPGTIFAATCNIGLAHIGTHTLDSAIEDRFAYRVDIGFPTPTVESKIIRDKTGVSANLANKLAKFGEDIRKKSFGATATLSRAVSTRQLLNTAILMREFAKQSVPVAKAADYTVVPYFSKEGGRESEQAQVLQLVQGIFAGHTEG